MLEEEQMNLQRGGVARWNVLNLFLFIIYIYYFKGYLVCVYIYIFFLRDIFMP